MNAPLQENTQALPTGTRLEEFVIERVLGSGGFGITYLARDTSLGRQVVIKENLPVQFCFRDTHSLTVSPRHTHGEDAENFRWSLENFSREAAMLASLDHPGIVRVLRSFQAFGTAYFVMPFVEGVPFDELINERHRQDKHFTEEELRELVQRTLGALDHLHDRGIYHRDIKPGNLLITHDGLPVLIDFGSARQRLSERSMTVIESAGYTPFEQLQSRGNVGPWSDLYALGGTLVKAITGETLPKANDRVFDDPWQPMASRQSEMAFSCAFLASIDCALALHPRDRWQNSGQWLVALSAKPELPVLPPTTPAVKAPAPSQTVTENPPPAAKHPAANLPKQLPGEEREFDLAPGCKIRMCWIPPGEFMMGSPEDELGRREDEMQHQVTLTRGFWMGKYPVTQQQWRSLMQTHPFSFGRLNLRTRLDNEACHRELARWENHPVESVSWIDICGSKDVNAGFLGKMNARAANGWHYDLPTEAEWEYACRAGNSSGINNLLDNLAWCYINSKGSTQPVGLKEPNDWGLHDMLGNVWEWCSDYYGTYPNGPLIDPKGTVSGDCRVVRGGSWANNALQCRAASRDYNDPLHANDQIGFRLVLRFHR